MKLRRYMGLVGLALLLACGAGCVEIRQTIELNEDGSGRFVEVVRLSDDLLEASKASPDFAGLLDCLSEERAKSRAKLLGEATFVSHEVKDLGAKGREATSVYAFKDINRFTLPATPHRGGNWPTQKLTFRMGRPVLVHEAWRNAYYWRKPLTIALEPKTETLRPAERSPSPVEREALKTLLPVLRTMLEDFRVTLTLEAFGPVDGGAKTHVIFALAGSDLMREDVLMTVIEWNRYPDTWLGARGGIGAGGIIRNDNYQVGIAMPFQKTDETTEAGKP
ncbi:MAG TPA: hypothetical protein VMY39_09410 [Planctomycetota bacterium]|nr:hypothetical protein [Planctomycetota bacterium]